jgi:hypothetical protein
MSGPEASEDPANREASRKVSPVWPAGAGVNGLS